MSSKSVTATKIQRPGTFGPKGSLLVRNTFLNILGQVIPLLIAVAAIPFIIDGLGVDRFGLLGLTWVVLSYFGLLNIGLGRATTKFVAEYLSRDETQMLPNLVWTAIAIQLLLGICGGVIMAMLVPILVNDVFVLPSSLLDEAERTFFLLAASLPFVLVITVLRGVLEGGQRFDLVNLVRVPANALIFLIPLSAIPFHVELPGIVFLLLISRLLAATAYLLLCFKAFPFLRKPFSFQKQVLPSLLAYSGWVSVSAAISPLLLYLDRFLIASVRSVAAVTFYTVPFEMLTRLSFLPGGLVATIFPAFSMLASVESRGELDHLFERSVKSVLLVMGALMLILFLFAYEVLQLWLGHVFAEKSASVFKIIAMGVLVNSLAFIPFTFLQGLGKPDITAKFHLIELPIHIALLWILLNQFGITGAALAWAIRVSIDAILLFVASGKLYGITVFARTGNEFLKGLAALFALGTAVSFVQTLSLPLFTRGTLVLLLTSLYAFCVWRYALDISDRRHISSGIGQIMAMAKFAR